MTPLERQTFRNYFWTAQLIGGLLMAGKLFVSEGLIGALAGFLFVVPFAALAAWLRVRWHRKHGFSERRDAGPRFMAIALAILLLGVLAIAAFDYWTS